MFDASFFPHEYECEECTTTDTVTQDDVMDVPEFFEVASIAAAHVMTERRGWSISLSGAYCPECADDE
jgi:hypothetical protein